MTTKKAVKKSTKKPSAKQIAARKKFAAAAKARAKKAKPKTAKTWTTTPSGKRTRTAAAKKARKAKNTVKGFYPNPIGYAIFICKTSAGKISGKKYFYSSSGWKTGGENAQIFKTKTSAENAAKHHGQKALDQLPAGYAVGLETFPK